MNLNVLKGLLIILVIADHNDFTRSLFPGFFLGLTFHVVGFMTIPFLKPAESIATQRFAHYVFRLYWPFLLITCALWLLVTLLEQAPLSHRLALLPLALYSGNAHLLKEVTNMGLLWFLPSFISVVALRNLMDTSGSTARRLAWIGLATAHLIIGAVARTIENYLPLGLLPALYMIPLAFAVAAIHRRLLAPMGVVPALILSVAAFAATKWLQMHWSLPNEVGFSVVADWRDPQALLVNDLEAITGTLMLFQIARINFGGVLAACGKYSMQIYLFHAFVALAIYKLVVHLFPEVPVALLFVGSLATTIVATLLLAAGITKVDLLRRLIFPRDPHDLPRP
jgi:fucose 4-O-acetylase-like acetyltransferase